MRQVRTCDFCGDAASGVYEPLPSSIPDAPRMLLCDACRDRLSSVVDPLLARMEGEADAGGRTGPASGEPDTARASTGAEAGSGVDPAGSNDAGSGTIDSDTAGSDDLSAREWPADPGERADAGPAQDEEATTAPEEAGRDEAGDPSDGTDAPPSSIDDLADDGGVEVSESRDASGRPQRERGGAPRGYRKVLRFLENRQLPIDRTEAEQLAADAYELDVDEVEAAIDHAVQYGRLREVSGELRR